MRSQVRVYREPCLGSDLLLAYVMHNPHPIGLISCFPPPLFFLWFGDITLHDIGRSVQVASCQPVTADGT